MKSPERDPTFHQSTIHGEAAQCELLRQVVKLCKQRRHAVDVGAHIGTWTRTLSARFEWVSAFEPVWENFECLIANAAGAKNARLMNVALGAQNGACGMKLPRGGNSGMWHLAPGKNVAVRTLDSFDLQAVDLIKMDVEGYEGEVVRGAFDTIQRCKPVIVLEDNGNGLKYFGADWVDPKPILASLGYMLRLRWRKDRVWTPSR